MNKKEALFAKDLFSNSAMGLSKIKESNSQAKNIKSVLKNFYPDVFKNLRSLKAAGTIEINSSNIFLETNLEEYVLKQLPLNEILKAEYLDFINNKISQNFNHAPKLLKNIEESFITVTSDFIFLLYEKVGDRHYSGKFSEFELFLKTYENYTEVLPTQDLDGFDTHPLMDRSCLQNLEKLNLLGNKMDLKLDHKIYEDIEKNYEMLEDKVINTLNHIEDFHFNDLAPYHTDLHPHNVSIDSHNLYFLDLESIQLTSLSRSLGFGIYKLVRQSISAGYDINLYHKFLNSEHFKNYLLRFKVNLEDLEISATQEVLRRIFIIINSILVSGQSEWSFVMPVHLNGLEEIEKIFGSGNSYKI